MALISEFKQGPSTLSLLEDGHVEQDLRPYLGMSSIGHSCDRFLWYSFRWFFRDTVSFRMLRLFGRGHREEPVIIEQLEKIGIKVHSDQLECEAAFGHCKGHNDGMCDNVPEAPKTTHLLEIKTMSDKYFKEMQKKGVKLCKPIYYAQMQAYMRKFKLKRALFIAVNKNDDSLYVERVRLDIEFADALFVKAEGIVLSETPPIKIFQSTWYECKFCSANKQCHFGADPLVTCRSCKNSEPALEGKWTCNKFDTNIPVEVQRTGCEHYKVMSL